MRPQKEAKDSSYFPPSGSQSSDDDDDFVVPQPDVSSSKPTAKREKLVPKKSKKNKENESKQKKGKDTQKQKIHNKTNSTTVTAIEAQRLRRAHSLSYSSRHIVHYLRNVTQGSQPLFWQDQSLNTPVLASVRRLGIYRTYLGFSRRATALAWHPTNPTIAAVGSKGGDIIVWNYEREVSGPRIFIEGQGPGGSIQAMKFVGGGSSCRAITASIDGTVTAQDFITNTHEQYLSTGANGSIQALKFNAVRPNLMYSASINGHLTCHEATRGRNLKVFLDTGDCDHWYTSLDVSTAGDVVVAGDNRGYVTLLTAAGEALWRERLHKMKVTHIEFCPRMPWCLVTASVDRSLKVWDVRNMKSRDTCLHSHYHERPVNSAHFSRTDGSRLVTTDQHSEIRVYSCPSFTHTLTIPHPHRQFQHLTPIKATWHPLRDIIVVGRYPDPSFSSEHPPHKGFAKDMLTVTKEARTVDFFDGATGELLHQLSDPGCSNKIVSLNLFGHSGDVLLSAAGMCVWIWKPKFKSEHEKKGGTPDKDVDSDNDNGDDRGTLKTKKRKAKGQMRPRTGKVIMKIDDRRKGY